MQCLVQLHAPNDLHLQIGSPISRWSVERVNSDGTPLDGYLCVEGGYRLNICPVRTTNGASGALLFDMQPFNLSDPSEPIDTIGGAVAVLARQIPVPGTFNCTCPQA